VFGTKIFGAGKDDNVVVSAAFTAQEPGTGKGKKQ
jgi:hypothetical protein